MAVVKLSGIELVMSIDGKVIGCAQEVSIEITTEMTEATCQASGGFSEFVAGKHTWTGSTSGIIRFTTGADVASNVTRKEIVGYQLARTPIDLTFGSAIVGDSQYAGTVLVSSTSQSGSESEATFTANFQGTGPIVESVNV